MTAERTALCVVQARMGSTRLPGKVLEPVGGRPMLQFLLNRLAPLGASDVDVVVATTDLPRDDRIAEEAANSGFACARGPEADVLRRFLLVLHAYPAKHVVRITADCPFTDPALVQTVLDRHLESGADYTSNVFPRTFPMGLDVEVVTADGLRIADAEAKSGGEREHVTPFLYRHPERFRLANLRHQAWLGEERWTVDAPADLAFVQATARSIHPLARWEDILAAVGVRRLPQPGAVHLRPAFASDADALLALRNDPDAVGFSTSGRSVGDAEHATWLADKLQDPATELLVAEVDGAVVGQLRVDVTNAAGEVSIAVTSAARGRGYGTTMLHLLMDCVRSSQQIDTLTASVHPQNTASLRLFTKVGFIPTYKKQGFDVLTLAVIRQE